MIDSSAMYLAKKLKQLNPEDTPSINIMRYSIKWILLNFVVSPILLIVSGLLVGDLNELMICAAGFVILRFFSGGIHINNAWLCATVSVVSFHLLVLCCSMVDNVTLTFRILSLVTLILVILYAPSNIEKQTKFKKENYKWLRLASILLVLTNLFLIDSLLLASAFFFQGLTLIRRRR